MNIQINDKSAIYGKFQVLNEKNFLKALLYYEQKLMRLDSVGHSTLHLSFTRSNLVEFLASIILCGV